MIQVLFPQVVVLGELEVLGVHQEVAVLVVLEVVLEVVPEADPVPRAVSIFTLGSVPEKKLMFPPCWPICEPQNWVSVP